MIAALLFHWEPVGDWLFVWKDHGRRTKQKKNKSSTADLGNLGKEQQDGHL
jgi:hypothetical protein